MDFEYFDSIRGTIDKEKILYPPAMDMPWHVPTLYLYDVNVGSRHGVT